MNDIDLYVFDASLNLLGIIDVYESSKFENKYYDHSTCVLTLSETQSVNELLVINDGDLRSQARILVRSDEIDEGQKISSGYLVETVLLNDGSKPYIEVYAYSLSVMLNWRKIYRQQVFNGKIGIVANSFVSTNCINTTANRVITDLVLGADPGIDIDVSEAFTDKDLDVSMWEMLAKYEMSYDIYINHETKKFEFTVFKGKDRSIAQKDNPIVVFSKEFENVLNQSYSDDKFSYRNTVFVAGEGEGGDRTIVEVGSANSGWNRRELFVDARDLQSDYDNGSGSSSIPPAEYTRLLTERGLNKLKEYPRVTSFETEISTDSQFKFNEHFFLGDIISNKNDDLGIFLNSRVVVANETFSKDGYQIDLEFGTAVPTLIQKIKRDVNN